MSIVPRRNLFRIAGLAAFGLVFSLVACDDSTSASNDEVQASSASPESSAIPESSAFPSSSSSFEPDSASCESAIASVSPYECSDSLQTDGVYYIRNGYDNQMIGMGCTYRCKDNKWSYVSSIPDGAIKFSTLDMLYQSEEIGMLSFKKCTTENEGLVDSVWSGNAKYGYIMYYRCEAGSWVEREQWVTCDTAGVPVGALCRRTANVGFFNRAPLTHVYVYEGEGTWMHLLGFRAVGDTNVYEGLSKMTKECSSKNKWDKEKITYGADPDVITLYYMCADSGWTVVDVAGYYCTTEKTAVGDTCSFESGDSTLHYMYVDVDGFYRGDYYDMESVWVESSVDPEFGYCPQTFTDPTELTYIQKNGKFYYCDFGKWVTAGFVPRQETDPRKEGLTDEEYDVLDLPKEATVGDRVGGLLENCFDNVRVNLGGPDEWYSETYDYCLSKNYYRYRENGTWTLETEEEQKAIQYSGPPECTPESEGMEYSYLPLSRDPGRIYKRIGVRSATIVTSLNTIEETFYCDDSLVAYIFGRSEKK